MPDPTPYEGWISIHDASTDYEADLMRDRLDAAGLDAVVLTQRDHAFNLNVGELAPVRVMVRPEHAEQARAVLAEQPVSDAELEAAAMSADPAAPDAHSAENEAALDSGIDAIRFSVPDGSVPDAAGAAPGAPAAGDPTPGDDPLR